MTKKKILVAGAGITGAVIARLLAEKGNEVEVHEKSAYIGGTCRDTIEHEAYSQIHGSHIFHTNNKEVWDFLSLFTEWIPYQHKVKALVKGSLVPVPFNINSVEQVAPNTFTKAVLKALLKESYYDAEFTLQELKEHKSDLVKNLGEYIEANVFKGYSMKQWGEMPSEKVLNRLKAFRLSKDDRYFTDDYQGIPIVGFTKLIEDILDHSNITVITNSNASLEHFIHYDNVFFTGPVDELFSYKLGKLPYRTCEFSSLVSKIPKTQEVAVINYPSDYSYTRSHDYSYYMPFMPNAMVALEYPMPYTEDYQERYYPIQSKENIDLYNEYKKLAYHTYPNLILAGRLGTYTYLNIDSAIAQAFEVVKPF